ncbi:MAG: hypothetical protein RLZZ502_1536 [Pseudomonadota bacterium]|jgi:pimeloyl-ACP methyl ester carboxylesterase
MSLYAYTGTRAFVASQPTVVFLHGAGNDHCVWAWQSRYLAHHGFNVLAYDLPGHGLSQDSVCHTVEEFAQCIANDLNARSLQRIALVGHSMGSLIALAITAALPGQISHLALIGTAVPMAVGEVLLQAAANDPHTAYAMIRDWGLSPTAQWAANPAPGQCMSAGAVRLMDLQVPHRLHADLQACKHFTDGLRLAENYHGKTMLILGAEDRMTLPKAAESLYQTLTRVEKHVLPGVGHNLMAEAPVSVRKLLYAFFTQAQ